MKKKIKQILAILAIVLLAGMYIASLVLAVIGSDWSTKMLQLSLVMTVLVPVILYVIMMFYKLNHHDNSEVFDSDNEEK